MTTKKNNSTINKNQQLYNRQKSLKEYYSELAKYYKILADTQKTKSDRTIAYAIVMQHRANISGTALSYDQDLCGPWDPEALPNVPMPEPYFDSPTKVWSKPLPKKLIADSLEISIYQLEEGIKNGRYQVRPFNENSTHPTSWQICLDNLDGLKIQALHEA